jgi:hypothetical protein
MAKKEKFIDDVIEYIEKNLKKGYTKESLKWALVNQGYSRYEVEKAIQQVDISLANKAPLLDTKPVIKYELVEPKIEPEKKSIWKRIFG